MRHPTYLPLIAAMLLAAPLAARADLNPDFDDDAKPILRHQPGLLEYVESRFDVKDTGTAKFPGSDDRAPRPPFIFRARPLGSNGPYNLRLLIEPGPPGHILGVVDINKTQLSAPPDASHPATASQPPVQQAPAHVTPAPATPTVAPSTATPAKAPVEPTSDTPSGPISSTANGQAAPLPPPPSSTPPTLAPPPDPAPASN